MTALKKGVGALVIIIIFTGMFYAAVLSEDRRELLPYFVIVLGALAISRIGRPKPLGISDGRTRKSLDMPSYVRDMMINRGFVIVFFGLIGSALEAPFIYAIGIAAFIGITEYTSRKYHSESPVEWEIAFHNDTDGFESGDGDGDGD